jgi:hypothetical protein
MVAARLPVMMYLHLVAMLMIVSEGWLGRAEYSGKRCERQGDFFHFRTPFVVAGRWTGRVTLGTRRFAEKSPR